MPQEFFTTAELASALQGIGGGATNKQSAKSPTIALLATIENGKTFPSLTNFRWQLIKWAKLYALVIEK